MGTVRISTHPLKMGGLKLLLMSKKLKIMAKSKISRKGKRKDSLNCSEYGHKFGKKSNSFMIETLPQISNLIIMMKMLSLTKLLPSMQKWRKWTKGLSPIF